jgi:hypothetical protein
MAAQKLPKRNVILILIFGVAIILFVLLMIFPKYIAYSNITEDIERLKTNIEEQKILSPIFEDFSKKADYKEPGNLPFPKKAPMSKSEAATISSVIQDIVIKNGFNLENIVTDVDALLQESGMLKLGIQMSGDFLNLRKVMLELNALPYLEHVESIQISSEGANSKIQLKLWFAQQ